jgi:MFS family permease
MASDAVADPAVTGWAVFRNRDFALYCASRFISAMGLQALNVSVGWLVYDLTGSAMALGMVGLAAFLPAVGLALFTGHVADRYDRRRVLMVCYAAATLVALGILAFALGIVGGGRIWPLFALVVALGAARAFANPAGQALVPNLVPPGQLGNAVAWNSSVLQSATIAGPAVGGLLYALGGAAAAFGVAAVGFAATVALLSGIRRRPAASGLGREPVSWATLLAGVTFIRSQPVILGAISLDLFAVLLGGATALLPIYARDILQTGPWGLGLLRSAPAVGAFCTALLLAHRPLRRRTGHRLFQAVALFGLATIGFGLSTSLPLSLACLVVLGASDMVSVFVRQTLVQLETPDAMRGRVAAVNSVFIGASNELGEFESGALAAAVGAVPAVVVGGVGTLLVAGLWAYWFPALRERDRLLSS